MKRTRRGRLLKKQSKTKSLVADLGKKEKQLRKELEDKKKITKRIETEIARIIEEERKKLVSADLTPDMKLIGN